MGGWLELTVSAALLAGLTSGVHCAAMCGPLVGIACGAHRAGPRPPGWLLRAVAYNAGRLTSYVAAGALTGAAGAAGLAVRGDPIVHQALLAIMGLSLIALAGYVAGFARFARALEAAGGALWRRVEPHARRFLPANTPARAFGLGLVWGWLPCGVVYVALISALATADPAHGALLMAAFGLGTLPNLLAISAWFGSFPRLATGRAARVLAAAVIAAVGLSGIAMAARTGLVSSDGAVCLRAPGIVSLLTGG